MRSECSFPFVFSPRVILSASPLEQNRILGDTDLGEVAEGAPPTSDGCECIHHGGSGGARNAGSDIESVTEQVGNVRGCGASNTVIDQRISSKTDKDIRG